MKRKNVWRQLGWLWLIWTIPPLLTTVGLLTQKLPASGPLAAIRLFGLQVSVWYPWIPLSYAILWLSRRFSLSGRHRWRHGAYHVGLALVIALLFQSYLIVIEMWSARGFSSVWSEFAPAWRRVSPTAILLNVMLYALVLILALMVDFYRRSRERETQWAQDRLAMLANQLQPHFLFNTLHAIATLMEDDVAAARTMIARLSDLLRASLSQGNGFEIDLRREIELLECYLNIQKVRFSDRLRVRFQIEEDVLGAQVPQLLLQPLVENAIRHGLGPDGGEVQITAVRQGENLILKVMDEGPGFPKDAPNRAGIGLANCRDRLAVLYDRDAWLKCDNRSGGGAEVVICLPFQLKRPLGGALEYPHRR